MAFGARHMAPSLFHLATHAERTFIRRHSEPLRANHIIFGANWHQLALAQWTTSIRYLISDTGRTLNGGEAREHSARKLGGFRYLITVG